MTPRNIQAHTLRPDHDVGAENPARSELKVYTEVVGTIKRETTDVGS